ncbi:MAG: hypothetical protein AAFP04_06145 [Myxococcota bacterium]
MTAQLRLGRMFLAAVILSLQVACSRPTPEIAAGRYFYRGFDTRCGSLEILGDGSIESSDFCRGSARLERSLFSGVTIRCEADQRFGLTPTLQGFALVQDGQVQGFLFRVLRDCQRDVAPPEAPTL